jgi:ornithine cyclodeaminase/alanine dehydrogenase
MKPLVAHLLDESGVQRAYDLIAVDDGEAAVGRADAIITITPATIPFIRAAWVRPGTHISAVGADMEGKQELETALVAHAKLFADDRAQSASSGEFEIPAKEGILAQEGTIAEIGEVIVGIAPGRTDRSQITVFDTSGIAVQDLAAGKVAYERAVERGMGASIEL